MLTMIEIGFYIHLAFTRYYLGDIAQKRKKVVYFDKNKFRFVTKPLEKSHV